MPRLVSIRDHFVASLGEFCGTFLFLFFAFGGTQTANMSSSTATVSTGPNLQQLTYISLVFGFSLAITVWIFFRVSGGLFNPAVTLSLCITGVVPPLRSAFLLVSQIVGAIAAAAVVKCIIPAPEVMFNVQLTKGMSVAQGLFLEMFLTTELVFTILMLAAEKTKATFVAPVGIGLALFVAELFGVYWTGGALNPARAFAPNVVMGSFPGYHWIYWLGPALGSLLASGFYALIKFLNYEEVNGDQDKASDEEKTIGSSRNDYEGGNPKPHSQIREPRDSRRSQTSQRSPRQTAGEQNRHSNTPHYEQYDHYQN
ncbi:related to aquaporin [Rhynchosporium agropyri]|uniref:Related to aquaporin n=2 Tax=Rhynchosporium TaxID=38037 RepID=A0A1E1LYN6_RHYSE|nr:related to aquaporin [Rhynchosporium agropyri]CZT41959.1 related to aquaporin [Rhynchosporium secalis]